MTQQPEPGTLAHHIAAAVMWHPAASDLTGHEVRDILDDINKMLDRFDIDAYTLTAPLDDDEAAPAPLSAPPANDICLELSGKAATYLDVGQTVTLTYDSDDPGTSADHFKVELVGTVEGSPIQAGETVSLSFNSRERETPTAPGHEPLFEDGKVNWSEFGRRLLETGKAEEPAPAPDIDVVITTDATDYNDGAERVRESWERFKATRAKELADGDSARDVTLPHADDQWDVDTSWTVTVGQDRSVWSADPSAPLSPATMEAAAIALDWRINNQNLAGRQFILDPGRAVLHPWVKAQRQFRYCEPQAIDSENAAIAAGAVAERLELDPEHGYSIGVLEAHLAALRGYYEADDVHPDAEETPTAE